MRERASRGVSRGRVWMIGCVLAALVALLPGVGAAAGARPGAGARARDAAAKPVQVTFMTRNLYLGANLLPLATAKPGPSFQRAVAAALRHVETTGPAARMKLIADEIASARPDLVGLQEASVWKTVSGGKTHLVTDYLASIMAELRRLHAPYRLVAQRLSLHLHGPIGQGAQVQFTDGNAVLARSGVTVSGLRAADFKHELVIPTQALGKITVNRSWISLQGVVAGARFHFLDTHLEAYSSSVRLQQAQDLVAGPLRSPLQTILVGDLNSSANLPAAADRPPFLAIRQAGFVDERTKQTNCCFNDDLRTGGWDHIVDHIMAKPGVRLVRSFLTGREKTGAGRHPSDHGGVVSVLTLKR